jgi:monofunctional chorismate mutase
VETNLDKLRDKINLIDKELVELIEQRMEIVTSIAEYKKKNNMEIHDSNREKVVIERAKALLKDENLGEYLTVFFFVKMYFHSEIVLHTYSHINICCRFHWRSNLNS